MNAAVTVVSWFDLLATTVVAGGLVWAAAVAVSDESGLRVLRLAVTVLALALLAQFVLTALRMRDVSGIGGADLVIDLLQTRWGMLWIARVAGLLLVAMALLRQWGSAGARATAAVVWLLPRSFQGHAGAHGNVQALIDWLHLAAASVWIGGLVQIAVVADLDVGAAWRFRRLVTGALLVLLPAGVYGALLHVPSVERLFGSPYGRALIAKIAAASALLALGAANHFRHVPALGSDGAAAARLRRNVRAEVVIGAVVLALSALLGVLPMPHEPLP